MKQKVYLDTSVPSRYYDDKRPEERRITRLWWENDMPKYDTLVSGVTVREMEATPEKELQEKLLELIKEFEVLEETEECKELARKYIEGGIIPEKIPNDALHIAVSTVNRIDILVSWNFEHMVNTDVRHKINGINLLNGYSEIEISSPLELGGGKYARV